MTIFRSPFSLPLFFFPVYSHSARIHAPRASHVFFVASSAAAAMHGTKRRVLYAAQEATAYTYTYSAPKPKEAKKTRGDGREGEGQRQKERETVRLNPRMRGQEGGGKRHIRGDKGEEGLAQTPCAGERKKRGRAIAYARRNEDSCRAKIR